ncbi:ABC transporter ATP-binding protein [Ethanoligenens sp.]|uniref:ABC transporter ATP-binding protein n=1 Tax=Ethanoligenens sp. TaxID=2099655 RepID=UPI0039EC5432
MALIEIDRLSFTYPKERKKALDNISLTIEEGAFWVLIGASGSGKSTLARHLKRELTPFGKTDGEVRYDGKPLKALDARTAATEIGFVLQNPENQTVTDKVWHELAFGLESIGLSTPVIRRRVAEMASFFGIQAWFEKDVHTLSGGQLQMLNLASVMVMQPRVLILDEPTSQLDPIAAADFLETVRRINRALSVTVVLTEHRLEEVFPMADRVAALEDGRILQCDSPRNIAKTFAVGGGRHPMFAGFPAAARIYAGAGGTGDCPLTVREGSKWLKDRCTGASAEKPAESSDCREISRQEPPAVRLRDIWFRYDKKGRDILKGISLDIHSGQIACLLGGNGVGKSTALGAIAGLHRPYRGKLELFGKSITKYDSEELYHGVIGMLPQDPQLLFVKDTVREDLAEAADNARLTEVVCKMGLEGLLERHPYDLSGGEQQKAAFAKVLMRSPGIILLDEPTKGLDAHFKNAFAAILKQLAQAGTTILMATHDLEFAAAYADTCLLFFNGTVVSQDAPAPFFAGNNFYTTAANRIARRVFPDAVTCEEVSHRCQARENPCG